MPTDFDENTVNLIYDTKGDLVKIQMPVDLPRRVKPEDCKVREMIRIPLKSQVVTHLENMMQKNGMTMEEVLDHVFSSLNAENKNKY